jgi:hypothetical protein
MGLPDELLVWQDDLPRHKARGACSGQKQLHGTAASYKPGFLWKCEDEQQMHLSMWASRNGCILLPLSQVPDFPIWRGRFEAALSERKRVSPWPSGSVRGIMTGFASHGCGFFFGHLYIILLQHDLHQDALMSCTLTYQCSPVSHQGSATATCKQALVSDLVAYLTSPGAERLSPCETRGAAAALSALAGAAGVQRKGAGSCQKVETSEITIQARGWS